MSENPFRRKMEEKNDAQLRHVLQNQDQFRSQAIEAAKEVLEERKDQPTESPKNEKSSSAFNPSEGESISPRFSLRAIATYQLISSLIILPSLFEYLFSFPEITIPNYLLLIFATLLYLFGLVSAFLIYTKKYSGLLLGLISNAFQLFQIQIGTFTYLSTGFLYIFIKVGANYGFNFNIGSSEFEMNFYNAIEHPFVGINLVAALATYIIYNAFLHQFRKGKFPKHLY